MGMGLSLEPSPEMINVMAMHLGTADAVHDHWPYGTADHKGDRNRGLEQFMNSCQIQSNKVFQSHTPSTLICFGRCDQASPFH